MRPRIVALAAAAACVLGFYAGYLRPAGARLRADRAQVAALRRQVRLDLADQADIPRLRASLAAEQRAAARRAVPSGPGPDAFVAGLQRLAARDGVRVTGLTFAPAQADRRAGVEVLPVALRATGGYASMAAFLRDVERGPRLVRVTGFHLVRMAAAGASPRARPAAQPAGGAGTAPAPAAYRLELRLELFSAGSPPAAAGRPGGRSQPQAPPTRAR
jgi:Tfp pilus assembly protein PilO